MLKITVHPRAEKELLKIPKPFRLKIIEKIDELKKLKHPLDTRK